MRKPNAVFFASVLASSLALADTVDNPGDFTLTFTAGTLKIGLLDPVAINLITIAGSVDGDGNVTIPAEGIVIPDITIGSPIGDVTVRFTPLADAAGTLIPVTGDATAEVVIRIGLIHTLLPAGCGIGPIDLPLTTGSDGDLTGVPYSMDDGTATYVNGTFSVPASDGCQFFGGIIDAQIGLPSPSGANSLDGLLGTFDPIFTGS